MNLGSNLLAFRKASNLSRKEVAHKIDVSEAALGHWETDIHKPSLDKLELLAELYGVKVSQLLGEVPEQPLSNEAKDFMLEKAVELIFGNDNSDNVKYFNDLAESDRRILVAVIDKFIDKHKEKSSR